jgi:threonine/homoserine/homoserine lactone efflux protein
MLDDSIVLAIAVVTLSNRRLQQSEARWMKLVAGVLMLALGLALVFKPDWLMG